MRSARRAVFVRTCIAEVFDKEFAEVGRREFDVPQWTGFNLLESWVKQFFVRDENADLAPI